MRRAWGVLCVLALLCAIGGVGRAQDASPAEPSDAQTAPPAPPAPATAPPRPAANPAEPEWPDDLADMRGDDGGRPQTRPRDGMFLRLSLLVGPSFLDSDANPLAGFMQSLSTNTSGFGGGIDAELGFGLSSHFALGAYLSYSLATALRIHAREQVASIRDGALGNLSLGGVATFQPSATSGWYGALRVGLGGVKVQSSGFESMQLRGTQLSLTVGKEWSSSNWWFGGGLRLTWASVSEGAGTDSTLIAPAAVGSVAWF